MDTDKVNVKKRGRRAGFKCKIQKKRYEVTLYVEELDSIIDLGQFSTYDEISTLLKIKPDKVRKIVNDKIKCKNIIINKI